MRQFKLLAWFYIITILLFLAMNGKNYYTLGAYPILMAAGGVFWEKYLQQKWKIWGLASFLVVGSLPIIPSGLPILSLERSVDYFDFMSNDLGITSLTRWEQGNIESLPQDYADMLGWEEIALLVQEAIQKAGGSERCLVYGENYGQAGSAMHFVRGLDKSQVVSFSDNYRLWASELLPAEIDVFIYINDELGEDVANLFADIELIGQIDIEHSRQRGVQVYLCRNPKTDFGAFWKERVLSVRENGSE